MDTVMLIGRLLVSLAVVLGVVWLIARRMRKTGRGKANGLIEVLDRRQLSRGSSVAVVRVGDQALVIGVTENQVSVLGETDAAQAQALTEAAHPAPRAAKTAARTRASVAKPARAVTSRHRNATTSRAAVRAARTSTPAAGTTSAAAEPTDAAAPPRAAGRTALAGSALSPQTWKQTIESLREMTAR